MKFDTKKMIIINNVIVFTNLAMVILAMLFGGIFDYIMFVTFALNIIVIIISAINVIRLNKKIKRQTKELELMIKKIELEKEITELKLEIYNSKKVEQ